MSGSPPVYSTLACDPELRELVAWFAAEMPSRAAALRARAERGDWDGLRRLAHQLKGSAGSYGYHALGPAAGRLEAACAAEASLHAVQAALAELLRLCERVTAEPPP